MKFLCVAFILSTLAGCYRCADGLGYSAHCGNGSTANQAPENQKNPPNKK